jgi:NAD(P)-dependent dehydrogenase (short-subunit alcohol dehydrogenase family)
VARSRRFSAGTGRVRGYFQATDSLSQNSADLEKNPMTRLKNKVAIVTGAASGIGRAIAQVFAQEGAKVIVADINDAGGQETVDLIKARDGEGLFLHCDVSLSAEVEKLVTDTIRSFEGVDILVNNAAYLKDFKTAVDTTEEEWDLSMDVTLKGVFLCFARERVSGGGAFFSRRRSGKGLFTNARVGIRMPTSSFQFRISNFDLRTPTCFNFPDCVIGPCCFSVT